MTHTDFGDVVAVNVDQSLRDALCGHSGEIYVYSGAQVQDPDYLSVSEAYDLMLAARDLMLGLESAVEELDPNIR